MLLPEQNPEVHVSIVAWIETVAPSFSIAEESKGTALAEGAVN